MSDDRERQLARRIMWRFIPLLGPCFTINWLDRTNVAFAGFTMNKDIGLSATAFGAGAGLFFLGYVLFEVPSGLVQARIGARLWIARIMVTWGILAAGMSLVGGTYSYYLARFLLGVAEGGFYPGVIYYFSLWIPYNQRAGALGILAVFASLALAVAGPLYSAIIQMDGFLGVAGWRWLFILEGLPAVILGCVCFFYLTDSPSEAHWLSPDDRTWLVQQLEGERLWLGANHRMSLWKAIADRRVLILSLVYFCFGLALFGVGLWTPLIIKQFGVTNANAGFLAAIPGLCGMASVIFWPRRSDRKKDRSGHLILMGTGTAAGLLLSAALAANPIAVMVGLCLAAFCSYGSFAIIMTWPGAAMSGAASAGATALITALGTTSGYFGPQLIGFLRDVTGGFQAAMACIAGGVLMAPVLLLLSGRFLNVSSLQRSARPERDGFVAASGPALGASGVDARPSSADACVDRRR